MALATDPHFTDKTISYTTVATLPEGDQRNKKSSYTAMARDHYIKISGGTGTWRLSGSGRVLHYPALPGPGRVLRQNVAGSD